MPKKPEEMTPEEFEHWRRKTIETLEPDCIPEMQACAEALELDFSEFLEILEQARDPNFYRHMGDNESYSDFDWDKIWRGYELLTGKKAPVSDYGYKRMPFTCSC